MIQNQIIGSSAWSSGINAIDNANYRAYEVIVPRVVANALYLMQDGTYSLDCKNDDNYKDEGEDNGNNEDEDNKGNDNENEMKSYNESDSENDSNGNN